MFPCDERLSSLTEGTYYSSKGRCEGVFLTVDDAYLVVNVNVFDKLVNEATFTEYVENKSGVSTYEEAKELYADRIIQEYLAEQEVKKQELVAQEVAEHNSRVKQVKMESLQKANSIRSKYADTKRKNILEMLLKGSTPAEIKEVLGYSTSVIYNALNSFEHDFVYACYNNDFVKKHIIREADFIKFVNLGFNYKKYLKYINDKKEKMSEIAPKPKREPVVEEVKEEVEVIRGTSLPEFEPKPVIKVDENEELPDYLSRDSMKMMKEQAILEVEEEALSYYKSQKKGLKSRDISAVAPKTVVFNVVREEKEVVSVPVYEEEEYNGEVDEWGNAI